MATNDIITVHAFGQEIGKVGYNEHRRASSFQYNPDFLQSGRYTNLFPNIIKRTPLPQVFRAFDHDNFRGLPPVIADSLPDVFGNTIFKAWMEANHKDFESISVVEQLSYVSNRGMGALEYFPSKNIPQNATINLDEIVRVLDIVLSEKKQILEEGLNSSALLNIFKIGSSAGGARPKVLVSKSKETGQLVPGDLEYSDAYEHYLVKLSISEDVGYSREAVEYAYYLAASKAGVEMMDTHMIDGMHFATKRFDRQHGQKQHILTATGLTGWAYSGDPRNSTYENLFRLAIHLKVSQRDLAQLFKRMVFNVVYANFDDHMKNHSFLYDKENDSWKLAPAYDLTYSVNPLINVIKNNRVLSINGKRAELTLADLLNVAQTFTIKNPKGIIDQVQSVAGFWQDQLAQQNLPERAVDRILRDRQHFNL